ncbi:uncharacterized protein AC631_02566 [Debaryomyces fabryi]|uniref:Cytidyltransferase-like domain-containing protein n=1 Tax=Debaryomyces fabryi TaxID=58627 RepID=A0A0V1PZZ2_9ASCO|nr:uncharacterized protein AC631_02566 [Debaryomyces fabryi]KSA01692.1 hypothetical protein AC631_02566 [Debaryomyces fabryi]CUM55546.1 unnamed protein product [Debaryomyces fabryi]
MTSKHPAILIKDPLQYDYDDFFSIVLEGLHKETPSLSTIDIIISQYIQISDDLNFCLSKIYNRLRRKAFDLGWDYTFEIDVLFNQESYSGLRESLNKIIHISDEESVIPKELTDIKTQGIKTKVYKIAKSNKKSKFKKHQEYDVTAVGGTFDHLHDGHKILLSLAVFLTCKTVIIGITGPKLLINKKYSEVLESYETRQLRVVAYLQKVLNYAITFEIFQINDVCGPTGYIKNIDALVVSEESSKGGDFVNKTRREKAYPELDVIVINVIGDENSNEQNNWLGKLSSTDIRKQEYTKHYK